MSNPIAVEVTRGPRVESFHRGSGAVVDAQGRIVFSFGDIERPVYPRSAIKAFQALPLLESGAADRLGLSEAEIALACASHSGEAAHVAAASHMLSKAGASVATLACGAHWPDNSAAVRALARSGAEPSALHNNCSGKHAGFLCLACARGFAFEGYERAEHPVQQEVRAAIEDLVGEKLTDDRRAIDGCSIPTYAISLKGIAQGFAKLGTGQGLSPERARAASRIRAAVAAHPFMVAGSGRFDTSAMELLGARAFTKIGAEGVACAALPEVGLGLAVKADDGAARAREVMIAALIDRFLTLEGAQRAALQRFVAPVLTNWRGAEVGAMRPAGPLASIQSDDGV